MAPSVFRLLSRLMIGLVLIVSPWLFGGVHESTQVWLFSGVLLALACAVPAMLLSERPSKIPLALFVLLLAVAWGFLQLVPLPKTVASLLSPGAPALRAQLLPAADSPDAELTREFSLPLDAWQPLSLRPAATRQDLTLLVMAVAAFLLGWQLFGDPQAALWLCAAVSVNGAILALFGLVQKLTWNGQFYWIGPQPGGTNPFAAFVNRNNAGGYLNLCLAAALALIVWAGLRGTDHATSKAAPRRTRPTAWINSRWQSIIAFFAQLDALKLSAYGLAVCITAGVLGTLSRGAGLALFGAGSILALLMALTRRRSGQPMWWVALALVSGLALVSWVGMLDALQARFETLSQPDDLVTHGRVPNWLDALQSVPDFWLAGSGLRTYRDIYLLHQHRYDPAWYYYAENQYIQALIDAGLVGLLLLLTVLALVAAAGWRLFLGPANANVVNDQRPDPRDGSEHRHTQRLFAMGLVGVFAVTSQAISGVFDFGLYVPSNMLLMAVLCGTIVGSSTELAASLLPRTTKRHSRPGAQKWLLAGVSAGLLAAGAWGCLDIHRVSCIGRALSDANFSETLTGATTGELTAAIEELTDLSTARPDDAELHYELAKLWIHLYRLGKLDELRAATPPEISLDTLWEQTSTTWLHKTAHELARQDQLDQLHQFQSDPLVSDQLRPALRELLLARDACPILAKVHLRLARLSVLVGHPSADRVHLERACSTGPSSTYTLTRSGRLHAQAGRLDAACRNWQASLTLNLSSLDVVWPWSEQAMTDAIFVEQVSPPIPDSLIELATGRFGTAEHAEIRGLLLDRASRLIDEADLPAEQQAHLRGRILGLQQRFAEAVEYYSVALQIQPTQAAWRFELAVLLEKQGRLNEAHEQAVRCVVMEPDNTAYDELLKRIIRAKLLRSREEREARSRDSGAQALPQSPP